ncbi:hypothetical protein Aduo_002204 [Ancylostoma duodenale]
MNEAVVWSSRKGVPSGVFKISDSSLTLPVMNDSDEPLVIEEGEELGRWSTDKWSEDRRKVLYEQIASNLASKLIDDDLANVLDKFEDVFAISDKELMRTNDFRQRADEDQSCGNEHRHWRKCSY